MINFHGLSGMADQRIRYVVIAARMNGRWIYGRHKDKETWEMPGGHREYDAVSGCFTETAMEAAERELKEETGAVRYTLRAVCTYAVCRENGEEEGGGLLAMADVEETEPLRHEIEELCLREELPGADQLTYPAIQPYLFERIRKFLRAEERMKGVRAVIADLDQTLLRTDKTLSDDTVSVLKGCRERGLKIVFATARPVRTVERYLKQIPCDAVIYHNGAFTLSGGRLIGRKRLVDGRRAGELLRFLHREYPGKRLAAEIQDTLYANYDVKEFWTFTDAVRTDFTNLPGEDADKLLIEVDGEEEYKDICGMLWDEVYGQPADGRLCLVMNKEATKFRAVRELAGFWGIPEDKMLAIGDDINDMEMLKGCGIGAAVENGLDEVRFLADYITGSNDTDGPAHFLEQKILKRTD